MPWVQGRCFCHCHSAVAAWGRSTTLQRPGCVVRHNPPGRFRAGEESHATGVALIKLEEDNRAQLDLFGETLRAEKFSRVYQAVDHMREKYGKHTVFLGSSFLAHKFGQHLGEW
jgi:hypothetical protein